METNEWKEKLMDDFCVMFERATQQDDTIDWVEKMETFISQNFIPISELKRWVEENEKEISNSIDKEEDRYWRRNRNNDLGHNSALKALSDKFIDKKIDVQKVMETAEEAGKVIRQAEEREASDKTWSREINEIIHKVYRWGIQNVDIRLQKPTNDELSIADAQIQIEQLLTSATIKAKESVFDKLISSMPSDAENLSTRQRACQRVGTNCHPPFNTNRRPSIEDDKNLYE